MSDMTEWFDNHQDHIYQLIAEVCDDVLGYEFFYHFMWDDKPSLIDKGMITDYNDGYNAFLDVVYQSVFDYYFDVDEEPDDNDIKQAAQEFIQENTFDLFDRQQLFADRLEEEFEKRSPSHLDYPFEFPDEDNNTLFVVKNIWGWLTLLERSDSGVDYTSAPDEFIKRIPNFYFDDEWIANERECVANGSLYLSYREELS